MLAIIDTHQHLWDLDILDLPWLEGAAPIDRSHVTADYLAETAGLNVVKAVYMEVDVEPSQRRKEADYILALCEDEAAPTVAAVISGSPVEADFRSYINQFKGNPYIKGVRQVLHVPSAKPGLCLEKSFVESIQYLGELGMSFDLCMRPGELFDGAKLAELCPETRLIVDHCGNAYPQVVNGSLDPASLLDDPFQHSKSQWEEAMAALAAQPNVVCKISGIVARVEKGAWSAADLAPTVNYCLDTFGEDRVIFGGDWPVCKFVASYAEWLKALHEIIGDRSESVQSKLLYDNAQRLYGLA